MVEIQTIGLEKKMIDLHIHTCASDGTDDTRSLLERLRQAGIKTFAVSDHDTVDGISSIEPLVPEDMMFIQGIEFGCITEVRNCHILGYGFTPVAKAFVRILEKSCQKKQEVIHRHIGFIASQYGIKLEEELIQLYGNGDWKQRLGEILVSMGKADDIKMAIEKYIKPCQTNDIRLDAREAIEAILAAGGIPVWAHPYGGYGKRDMDDEEFNKQLHILMDAGLQGLECYYSAFDQEQVEKLLATAQKHNLLVSGGSDYHGDRKNIQLGTLNVYGKIVTEEELTIVDALKQRQNR